MYKTWTDDLQELLKPSYQMAAIRKNLYTVLFVVDPTAPAARQAVATALYYRQAGAPLRMGFVFTSAALTAAAKRAIAEGRVDAGGVPLAAKRDKCPHSFFGVSPSSFTSRAVLKYFGFRFYCAQASPSSTLTFF